MAACTEEIQWRCVVDDPPDDDVLVLLCAAACGERHCWPGWHEGDEWFWVEGKPVEANVLFWADLPGGPDFEVLE